MSTIAQLEEAYTQQARALIQKRKSCAGELDTVRKRGAFWKFHRRMRKKIYPRGTDFVLKFQGMRWS